MQSTVNVPESIETARLQLRCPVPGDGAALKAAIMETLNELRQWMAWSAIDDEAIETLVRLSYFQFAARENLAFVFRRKVASEIIGMVRLHTINWAVPKFEIGYWCRKSYQGQGYVSEAVAAVANLAFEVLGARRIEIQCDEQNLASRKVAEKLGFRLEAIFVNDDIDEAGVMRNSLIFAKTR